MPNPYTAGPGDGCMVHAGILTPHGGDKNKAELTSGFPEAAKERFIEDVIKELNQDGSAEAPPSFPCGGKIPPVSPEMAERLRRDLPKEEVFPDFHKNILGYYRDLARSLDVESEYKFLPVADPVALGTSLGANVKVNSLGELIPFMIPNPPLLAAKLQINLLELPGKLATLPLPKLPPKIDIPLPEIPQLGIGLPSLEIPSLLNFKLAMIKNFPSFMGNLIAGIPDIAIKLMTLDIPGALGDVCKMIAESGLFGAPIPPTDDSGVNPDIILVVSRKVLAKKMAEMSIFHAVTKTLGTSPSGLVGLSAKHISLDPPLGATEDEDPEKKSRNAMHRFMASHSNIFWSKDPEKYSSTILPAEYTGTGRFGPSVGQKMAAEPSSCGMYARVVLAAGGAQWYYEKDARDVMKASFFFNEDNKPEPKGTTKDFGKTVIAVDWFNDVYRGNAVAHLISMSKARGADMIKHDSPVGFCDNFTNKLPGKSERSRWPTNSESLPSLKRGDIIIVTAQPGVANREHVIVVAEDYYEGSEYLYTVEGGSADVNNVGKASYIGVKKTNAAEQGGGWQGAISAAGKNAFWTINNTPGTGIRCTGITTKQYALVKKFSPRPYYSQPQHMGPNDRGYFAMGDGRVVAYIIDSWKLITGNPLAPAPQPGSNPLASKQLVDTPDIVGDSNLEGEDREEEIKYPTPDLTVVPVPADYKR